MNLTFSECTLQLFSNSQELCSCPKVGSDVLAHAERPAAAQNVPPVFPYGAEALLEQVDGLAHLDLVDRGVVVVAPEILNGLDQGVKLLETLLVVLAIFGLLLFLLLPDSRNCVSWMLVRGGEETSVSAGR